MNWPEPKSLSAGAATSTIWPRARRASVTCAGMAASISTESPRFHFQRGASHAACGCCR
ncbi:Uncharacterised protein [Bordetella pertussis]|nr:Uncharacterised protein [Bordetella pertussis]CFW36457.1 Uncharacterised protein [Bordetella pertussis]